MIKGVLKEMGLHTFSNIYLKRLFPKLMMAYCFFMHNCISLRFEHLAHMVQTKPLEVPTLFFYSENDPITNILIHPRTGYRVQKNWFIPCARQVLVLVEACCSFNG